MVTSRFKWSDGRSIEQVTKATAAGLRVSYVVDGLVIAETIRAASPPVTPIRALPVSSTEPDSQAGNTPESGNTPAEPISTAEPIFTPDVKNLESVNMAPGSEASAPDVTRGEAARIRGMWAGLFGTAAAMGSDGIIYTINNLTSVHIPSGYALVAGASLTGLLTGTQYLVKKYAKPDGKW